MMTFIMPLIQATSVPGFCLRKRVILDERDLAGLDDDELGAALADGPLHVHAHDGVILRRVGARGEDHVGKLDLVHGVRHGTAAEGGGQPGHRGAVSETRAVIDIVGPDRRPHEFLEDVVVLVGARAPTRAPRSRRGRALP